MTLATNLDVDLPCPAAPTDPLRRSALSGEHGDPSTRASGLHAVHRPFDTIDPATWDRLVEATTWATPFARWAFHRAWWDAYGGGAHDETIVIVDPSGSDPTEPIAIVPLMHRHAVELTDADRRTSMRTSGTDTVTPGGPSSRAIYFGASYHSDYATVLCPADRLDQAASALAQALAPGVPDDGRHVEPWDVVDLRRLRCGDPVADALCRSLALVGVSNNWSVHLEREDVCPVISIPEGLDFDGFIATLGKKERHEIRRKIRRAESCGEVRLDASSDPIGDLDAFVDLHQKRWGVDGLFPPTSGGDASRTFFRRLFELFGPSGMIRLSFLTVAGRRIAAGVWFDDGQTIFYYNAGVEPDARDLSPGVNLVASSLREALALGRRRFDFLRGDEAYKYEWGAVDEPIQRLLVRRT